MLATLRPDGRARLLPLAYALAPADPGRPERVLYSALDEKPKRVADPRRLARVSDILADARVTLLVDRWSEDWHELAWLRLDGRAALLGPASADATEHAEAIRLLRLRYEQYAGQALEQRPILRLTVERATYWSARDAGG